MASVLDNEEIVTLADLLARLGGVPLDRVRFRPTPGTASEQDVIGCWEQDIGLFELVDGTLIQKPPSFRNSVLATSLRSSRPIAGFYRRATAALLRAWFFVSAG